MGKETLQHIVFEDLSIMEILTYMDHSFCSAKFQYIKYNKDLRKAWDEISEEHYDAFCNVIGLVTERGKEIGEASKLLYKLMDPDEVSEGAVLNQLKSHFPAQWFKAKTLTPEQEEAQFKLFQKELFHYLETKFVANQSVWNMKLVRRKEPKKGKKR